MADPATLVDDVGRLAAALTDIGLEPILVGGMALVTLGSRRVTRDFDFVIARPGDRLNALVNVLYDCDLELAARVNDAGDVTATIDNRRVAAIRLRIDAPSSASFYCHGTGLRVDLLFDFPLPVATLAKTASRTTVQSWSFRIASETDLLRLKRIARTRRRVPADAEDVKFLRARAQRKRS